MGSPHSLQVIISTSAMGFFSVGKSIFKPPDLAVLTARSLFGLRFDQICRCLPGGSAFAEGLIMLLLKLTR